MSLFINQPDNSFFQQYPFLREFSMEDIAEEYNLGELFKDYTENVSKDGSTISLELCCFLLKMCLELKPESILDLGSGLSSFIFAIYHKTAKECRITSVDDNEEWLLKTRNYLTENDMPVHGLVYWNDFIQQPVESYDFIFNDIGPHAGRANAVSKILSMTHNKSTLIIDDLHKPHFLKPIKENLEEGGITEVYDVTEFTLDHFGRFSWLINKFS